MLAQVGFCEELKDVERLVYFAANILPLHIYEAKCQQVRYQKEDKEKKEKKEKKKTRKKIKNRKKSGWSDV